MSLSEDLRSTRYRVSPQSLASELDAMQAKINAMETHEGGGTGRGEAAAIRAIMRDLEAMQQSLDEMRTALAAAQSTLEAERTAWAKEREALTAQVGEATEEAEEESEECERLEEEVSRLTYERAKIEGQWLASAATIGAMEEQLGHERASRAALEKQVTELARGAQQMAKVAQAAQTLVHAPDPAPQPTGWKLSVTSRDRSGAISDISVIPAT